MAGKSNPAFDALVGLMMLAFLAFMVAGALLESGPRMSLGGLMLGLMLVGWLAYTVGKAVGRTETKEEAATEREEEPETQMPRTRMPL